MLKQHAQADKLTAAVCAAPLVLSDAGLLEGKKATSFPSVREQLQVGEYLTVPVVVDGQIVTGRGPGTAMAFALKLVEILMGADVAAKLAENMLHSS
jgi:4-methyl-5(b-hydroxyethyl)-thiazole monophosphate biosynthesis